MERVTPIIGRREELEFLRAAVERRGAVLAGVAGVGKTRVAAEIAASMPEWHVAWATVTPSTAEVPFGGLAALDLDDVIEATPPGLLLPRLVGAVVERGCGRKVLVVVDDAHLLDDQSVGLLHRLVSTQRASVLATVRTGERLTPGLLALYKDGLVPRLELQPLSRSEFSAVVSNYVGRRVDPATLQRLWSLTDGNVLFVRELIADALDAGAFEEVDGYWVWTKEQPIGPRLTELIAERMGRLEGHRRLLAEVLAIAEPVAVSVLQRIVEGVDLADEERRGLVSVSELGRRAFVRLAHPLFAEAVRAQMPVLTRRDIQRRLADAVGAMGGRRSRDLLRVALWQVESATASDAATLLKAARYARQTFNAELAVRLANAAIQLEPSFAARLTLGAAMSELGRFDEAAEILDPLVGSEPDAAARQELARERAWAHFHQPAGLDAARQILDVVENMPDGDPLHRLLARGDLALLATYAGRFTEALEIGAPLLAPRVDDRVRIRALPSVGACLVMSGKTDRVLQLCAEIEAAVSSATRLDVPQAAGWLWAMRTNALILSGRLNEAVETLVAPLESDASPLLPVGDMAYARTKLGAVHLMVGRPEAALTALTAAARVLRHNDPNCVLAWCLSLTAQAFAMLGRSEQAAALSAEALAQRLDGRTTFDGEAARARSWVLAAAGERSRATAELMAVARAEEANGQPAFALLAWHDALRWGAPHVAEHLQKLATSLDGPGPAAIAMHAAAVAEKDSDLADAAAQQFADLGHSSTAAELELQAARWWKSRGNAVRAAAARARGESWLPSEVVVSPVVPDDDVVAVLTRREAEVARLASQGLANAEIARKLVLSVRTVESHLYSAYGKLGVNDRAELAVAIRAVATKP